MCLGWKLDIKMVVGMSIYVDSKAGSWTVHLNKKKMQAIFIRVKHADFVVCYRLLRNNIL